MSMLKVSPAKAFDKSVSTIPGDKSVSHRCAIFSMLSDQPSTVRNYLKAEDTMDSLNIAILLGAEVVEEDGVITITPPGELKEPEEILYCGNSGTAMRLYAGFLASLDGFFILDGDEYLRRRPMKRVAAPLRSVGAKIDGRRNGDLAPLAIRGGTLNSFTYESPIASAQVKSAMILAALRGDGVSKFKEPELSRDHTERMLKGMGATIENDEGWIHVHPLTGPLKPLEITVPCDPSSAFFFAVAAAIVPGSRIILENVTLNPTRVEAFHVLKRMGAEVIFTETDNTYEPIGTITVAHMGLKAVEVSENISWLIDELPALSVAMSFAEGTSVIKNAEELRVKESDRIKSVVDNLNLCGVTTTEYEDGYTVTGGGMKPAVVESKGDHRIAMSFAVAGLACGGMEIHDVACINTSFPNFIQLLSTLTDVEHAG